MAHIISGIQQVGIGVTDMKSAYAWYSNTLGMDIPLFVEAAEADQMLLYTGGKAHFRQATLAVNIKGGGGFEIWQYTSRIPQAPVFIPQAGDLGIFCPKIKTDNIRATYNFLKEKNVKTIGEPCKGPDGSDHFYMEDPYGNLFEIFQGRDWFARGLRHTGGVAGAVIGVSDMSRSIQFYSDILGYDQILYREENTFNDFKLLPGGTKTLERVLLTHSKDRVGPFSVMLGKSYIELIKVKDRTPRKIFENRYWGDLGFIHLCFDVRNINILRKKCEQAGHQFTVDGGAMFEMGEASGHFCYIEDPDGTLIEFVEARKIPLVKKFNWYLDLRKRPSGKALPKWLLRSLKFSRKKEIDLPN